ncbi:oxidoreductase [Halobacteriovorax sp. GFR7]|uniref:NADH-quinone oxidoreductase subunit B family protein n=1 Tax=unclassified Halobacteriovorax TaxID=2639665 RepID=UPI003D997FF6
MKRPKLAVWKFTSCDGCQLSLLDLEEDLILLSEKAEFVYFMEAIRTKPSGPYDLSIVEGSISTPKEAQLIKEIRNQSKFVLVIGACATSGGIQALRNFKDVKEFTSIVYASPSYIDTLETSTPISDHIKVDFELRGCPINKWQLLEVITSFIHQKKPNIANQSVCVECKLAGNICVMVAKGIPCLGQVTHAGCGALCPAYDRGCYGCYGPVKDANNKSVINWLLKKGLTSRELINNFQNFNCNAIENRELEKIINEQKKDHKG